MTGTLIDLSKYKNGVLYILSNIIELIYLKIFLLKKAKWVNYKISRYKLEYIFS